MRQPIDSMPSATRRFSLSCAIRSLMKYGITAAVLALWVGCTPQGKRRIERTRNQVKAADLVILCSIDTQSEGPRYRVDEIWKGHRFAQPFLTNGFLAWEYSLRDMTPQPEAVLLTLKTGGKKAEPTSLLDAEFHFFYKNPELGEDINVSTLKKIKDTSELE